MNAFAAEAMFIIASIIHFGKSGLPKTAITEDDLDRYVFILTNYIYISLQTKFDDKSVE